MSPYSSRLLDTPALDLQLGIGEYAMWYFRLMCGMWDCGLNEQRPLMREAISALKGRFESIWDIGAGDGFLLPYFQASRCTIVEPNPLLREKATARARAVCDDVAVYANCRELLADCKVCDAGVVLLSHSLFYLSLSELRLLLVRIARRAIVVIHPDTRNSATVECGRYLGCDGTSSRVMLKERILGAPTFREVQQTHFHLPLETSDRDIAFLLGHLELKQGSDVNSERLLQVIQFLHSKRQDWISNGRYAIPQWQVIEFYNIS